MSRDNDITKRQMDKIRAQAQAVERGWEREKSTVRLASIYEEFEHILVHEEGYVRMGKQRDGQYYVRWKWTGGGFDGRYTYASGATLTDALEGLVDNVDAVLSGKRKATYDNDYSERRKASQRRS